jgi:hypothetical protein
MKMNRFGTLAALLLAATMRSLAATNPVLPDQIVTGIKRLRELRAQIKDNLQRNSTTNSPR